MNTDRIFVGGCAGGVMGIIATCVNHFPVMFQKRFEYDQLIKEAMKLEIPPSFKSIFVKNLTGIPTSLAVITVSSLSTLGIKYVAHDYFNKQKKEDILDGIAAVATTAFTFYQTRSAGLTAVNLVLSLLPFYGKDFNPLIFPIFSTAVSGSLSLVGRTLCSVYEQLSNSRSYQRKFNLLIKENYNEYLDYNNGAARKVSEVLGNLLPVFFKDGAKNLGFSIISTSVAISLSQITAKATGVKEAKKQNQIASICGIVSGGALSFYLTRSVGLSSINATISALAPICFPRTC